MESQTDLLSCPVGLIKDVLQQSCLRFLTRYQLLVVRETKRAWEEHTLRQGGVTNKQTNKQQTNKQTNKQTVNICTLIGLVADHWSID